MPLTSGFPTKKCQKYQKMCPLGIPYLLLTRNARSGYGRSIAIWVTSCLSCSVS